MDTRPTAQQFLRKEKLSLTPCLCGPTQLTPHQVFLPLMLLASLSGLLRFQTALKVIRSQAYLKQTDQETDLLYKFTNMGNKQNLGTIQTIHIAFRYEKYLHLFATSTTLFMFHETEALLPIYQSCCTSSISL